MSKCPNFFTQVLFALAILCTSEADDLPPGVVDTQDPNDVSLLPEESLARITVPEGFNVTLFAGEPDLRRPIAFDFDDRGRLWVVENYSHPYFEQETGSDRILIFEDADHDGRFDKRTVFWNKGRYLSGIAIGHGGVWIANTPELSFIPDLDGDDVPDSEPVVVLDGFVRTQNNVLNNFHWGPDGWLYGAIGIQATSFVGPPGTARGERVPMTRGIWRFHPVHRTFEVVAEGMINPWGADFNEYGDLFTANTVIAHLWHIVPGMKCQSRSGDRNHRYAYGLIQSITDHLHWGGGVWHKSRDSSDERHSVAGGGHAHCGAMIYLGDNWPAKYRSTFFTNNLHGNRVNNDRLVPNKSTYTGVHSDDFLFGNDPWFRGLTIKYGPDGGVYVSDWHEFGECHDSDGSHRSSGRLYKVVFGQPEKRNIDLKRLSDLDLAGLHVHPNEWFVRHARRILHERAAAGQDVGAAQGRLREMFESATDETHRLRALWTLFVIGAFDEAALVELLDHPSEHVRRWVICFLVDKKTQPSQATLAAMARLAKDDPSPKVRLALASTLQRLKLEDRMNIAKGLASHAGDAQDPHLPLMIWYGLEPLVMANREAALRLASDAKIPILRRFIARRALDDKHPAVEEVFSAVARTPVEAVRLDLLGGALDALDERGQQTAPPSWEALYRQVSASADPKLRSIAVRLATVFGDEQALADLRAKALGAQFPEDERRAAFRTLLKLDVGVPVSMLHDLVNDSPALRKDAIQALAVRSEDDSARTLLDRYAEFNLAERQAAVGVLGTRRDFAMALLGAIDAGAVDRNDVSVFALQQLRHYGDTEITKRITALWKDDASSLLKADQLARLKGKMTPDYLETGDARAGRVLFDKTCASCHMLFGEGNDLGPDLTGSGRQDTDYVLSNLIDPNATIDEAFRLTTVLTKSGKFFGGFIIHQDDEFLDLRMQEARMHVPLADVAEIHTSSTSMMPEGMLATFNDEQVRDLLRYLASPQQVDRPQVEPR
ncbi:MAG: putative membrane-bound dehydrogenase-like protein [Verrucomicrobiales bacterium]|jgi:putative membrane-bound dehydrogenase-like protein